MEGSSFFSVQRLGDKHVAVDGIYVVDTTRGLISACSGDAVADAHILILIRADLRTEPEKQVEQRGKSFFFFSPFKLCLQLQQKVQNVQSRTVCDINCQKHTMTLN